MEATTRLIDHYMHAAKRFQIAETIRDALPATATPERIEQLERECDEAWAQREVARRAYWSALPCL